MFYTASIIKDDAKLIRWSYRVSIEAFSNEVRVTLHEFTIEERQTTHHKFRIVASWAKRPRSYWEHIGHRKIETDEMQTMIPNNFVAWLSIQIHLNMKVQPL